MTNETDRIAGKYLHKPNTAPDGQPSAGWRESAKRRLRKGAVWAAGIGALVAAGAGWLKYDELTKRQDYPIRNVLYQAKEQMTFMGTEKGRSADAAAMTSESILQTGDVLTKLGNTIGRVKYHYTDEFMQYQLEDAAQRRIAFASEKHERVQSGMNIRGTINFLERQAELVGQPGKFATYSFIPERGCTDIELNLLFDEEGKPTLANEVVARRDCRLGLGFFNGTDYRRGTDLKAFRKTPKNAALEQELFGIVERFNTHQLSIGEREKMIGRMYEIRGELDKIDVVVADEDGLLDWFPQESTTYLFGSPKGARSGVSAGRAGVYPEDGSWSQLAHLVINNDSGVAVKLRVENDWDLWPGRIIGLKGLSFGSDKDTWMPFAKYNNGGYEIIDGTGTVAQVRFRDFFRRYGKDVLYEYYLDKDGNGKIDEEKESIGSVLFHIDNDENIDLGDLLGKKADKKDITFNFVYSFMRGSDAGTAHQDFYLCNTIESFMMNESNRGYGKHSYLGYVNTQRSNILLLETRTVPNLSRALTVESAVVAEQDIVNLLRAAGRDYVNRYVTASPAAGSPSDGKSVLMKTDNQPEDSK